MTSTLKINTIEPEGATTTLTVGESGQNTVIAGAGIKANVAKDAGANALFTSDGSGNISGLNSGFGSPQVLISTQAFTGQATVSFTSGIDSTYNHYLFEFFELNPVDNAVDFRFQVNASGQTGYDEVITSSAFMAHHYENDTSSGLAYSAGYDQAQGTAPQIICENIGNQADECGAGELHLYNPASTTQIKNFYSRFSLLAASDYSGDIFIGGYINTASAIDEVQFSFESGNFDGTIKMYGIK